jgi:exosome complex exonuclease RRP6
MVFRPLPDEMFFYARADTHYLLYIYDKMRNELIDRSNPAVPEENRIEITLQKSKEVSLLRYERQVYNVDNGRGPGGWFSLLVKTPALFNNTQFAVFRAVHKWRDEIARTDDDSTNFVMPNHVIFNISKLLPNDMVALLSIAHPISYSVKSRSSELLEVIIKAKAKGKDGPSMMDILRPDSLGAVAKANIPALAAKAKFTSEPMVAVVDEGDLRTENSTFWGGAFGSSIWDEESMTDKTQELRLAVPLPKLSSEIFGASNGSEAAVPKFSSAPSLPLTPVEPVNSADEAFVLKRGSKRKSEAIEDPEEGEASGEYDISLNDLEDQEVDEDGLTKKQRKAQRRAEKRAKKEAKVVAKGVDVLDKDEDEEPFDYSKAESVLNSKRKVEQGGGKGKGKGKKGENQKPFDPYAKSGDASKGMRRAQTERAGKSHTFRS